MNDLLKTIILGNTLADYLIFFSMIIGGSCGIYFFRRLFIRRFKRWVLSTPNRFDDGLLEIIKPTLFPGLYLGLFYIAFNGLNFHPGIHALMNIVAITVATVIGVIFCNKLAEYCLDLYVGLSEGDRTLDPHRDNLNSSLYSLLPAIRVFFWVIGFLFLLDNLGFNISAMVTSLGIGGVAIALASQGFLQDLFGYFAILLDRPFDLGDFIVVGEFMGTIDKVGVKTTRMKSIGGEELIIANSDLMKSRIRNFKRMDKRRVVFTLRVTYQTSVEQLEAIPDLIQQAIISNEDTIFDRAHFVRYGEFSLDFEVVYYVMGNDYHRYADIQQRVNFWIKQAFEQRGIAFAYPTQVTYAHDSIPRTLPEMEPPNNS